jgi:hypothetical protein
MTREDDRDESIAASGIAHVPNIVENGHITHDPRRHVQFLCKPIHQPF